ncbi:hypothetical protein RMATCC62417_10745 [Rhizopus microsporus]|nr:hypothetical protein RMATCC62417_10745 [Rhizopus microsporus]
MKDAGLIIGRGGKNVSKIRESSMARVNVSDIIPSAVERILTVIGPAYALVAEKIIEESALAEENQSAPPQQDITIKILILSNRMGCIIGKSGSVIKSIQESSGARVTAAEEPLPLSSERVLSIHGTPQMIEQAVKRVGDILIEQTTQPTGYTLYKPIPGGAQSYSSHSSSGSQRSTSRRPHDNNMNSAAAVAMMGYAGTPESNQIALYLLYSRLEAEQRRVGTRYNDSQK